MDADAGFHWMIVEIGKVLYKVDEVRQMHTGVKIKKRLRSGRSLFLIK